MYCTKYAGADSIALAPSSSTPVYFVHTRNVNTNKFATLLYYLLYVQDIENKIIHSFNKYVKDHLRSISNDSSASSGMSLKNSHFCL